MPVDPGKLHNFVNAPAKPVFGGKPGGGKPPGGQMPGGGGKPNFGGGGGKPAAGKPNFGKHEGQGQGQGQGGGGQQEEHGEHDNAPKHSAVSEAVKAAGGEVEEILDAEMQALTLDSEPNEELVAQLQGSLAKLGEAGVNIKNAAKGLELDDALAAAEELQQAGLTEEPDRLAAWLFFIGKLAAVGG